MYSDLREFLDDLERGGELVRIRDEISDGHEVFSIIWELNRKKGPAILLENIKGFNIPIVTNIFGTLDRFAMACGFPRDRTIINIGIYLWSGWAKPIGSSPG